MSLAYQNVSAEDLSDPSLNTDKARRTHLLDTYIGRMFNRKASARPYEDVQTKQRLSWLARNMQKHNQEIFLIEGLQPSWLSTRGWRWLYLLASRLVSISVILSIMLPGWDILWFIFLTIIGLIAGLSVSFVDALRFEWFLKRRERRKFPTFWWAVINIVAVCCSLGMIVGLIVGLINMLTGWPNYDYDLSLSPDLSYNPFPGLSAGIIFGIIFGLIFGIRGSRQSPESDIKTVESLQWFWRDAIKGGLMGGIVGLGLSTGLISTLTHGYIFGLSNELSYVFFLGLMGAILNGLRREIIKTKSVTNQGTQLSIRNAILAGLGVELICTLIFGIIFALFSVPFELSVELIIGLFLLGMPFGLIGALWYGGLDVIQHYTLRIILLIQEHTPANYARFLDYAVDRIFLQQVGGGYRFIHRLLLEHFAEMGEVK